MLRPNKLVLAVHVEILSCNKSLDIFSFLSLLLEISSLESCQLSQACYLRATAHRRRPEKPPTPP